MTRGRRVAVTAAGFIGAEVLGAVGFVLAAGLLAFDRAGPAVAAIVLAPVFAAAGGPVGYDLATWWADDDEEMSRAEPGSRAGVHAAGVVVALLVLLVCLSVAAAAPRAPTVYLFLVALCCLPVIAVAGRRLAVAAFSQSATLLPMSLVGVVTTALALFVAYNLFVTRMFGDE